MKDNILFRGDKKVWFDFTNQVRKQKKTIWEVLKPMLEGYIFKEETLRDNENAK